MYSDYIEPPECPPMCCHDCGRELSDDEPIYYDEGWICEECMEESLENNYLVSEIADALKIRRCTPATMDY